ncbi:DUF6056 family protein [Sphingomonas jatrophae]|uniref:DUF2029 domain-containing protein n=1 Tax=Sphingomonas jatrophae TaxID=1166337 RepID=A0A1I6K0C0_9SPHN|nr:DUF6056 family protein [Sphingomonas jatrophae]SFR84692.1 hypothetical protein SAMN05192580_1166 [Sphingomonas jatrophae]
MLDVKLIRRLAIVAVLGASLVTILLAAIYARFAYPYLDDFCFMGSSGDPVATANFYYRTWSGRWSAMFLYALLAQGHDYAGEDVGGFVIWSGPIWYAGFYLICATAMRARSVRDKAGAALILLAVFWSASPGISDLFYWLAGIISYPVPFFFSALALYLLLKPGARLRHIVPGIAAAFLAPTFNELAGIALAPALAGVILGKLLDRERPLGLAAALVATLAATALVVFAPGTDVRLSAAPAGDVGLLGSAVKLFRPYDSAFAYAVDPRILALVMIAACSTSLGLAGGRRWWQVALLSLCVAATANAAFVLATGQVPSYRVLGSCFAILLAGSAFVAWHVRGRTAHPALEIAALAALAGSIVTAPNVAMALHDLPKAAAWKASQAAFWAELSRARGRDVAVADLPYYPSIFFNRQIDPDPADRSNRCVAARFGLRSLRSVGPAGARWRVY